VLQIQSYKRRPPLQRWTFIFGWDSHLNNVGIYLNQFIGLGLQLAWANSSGFPIRLSFT
jgi:hypothetical protein